MLVLSRKKSERIILGDAWVELVVVDIRGDKVRLGIRAPDSLSVHRAEIYHAIERERTCHARRSTGRTITQPVATWSAAGHAATPRAIDSGGLSLTLEFPTRDALMSALLLGRTELQAGG